ncbi:hypothetical protein MTR67_005645 [Solanum verrucosum]|uniref:Uncharacterized protein n=1 Tax=Solanum verrucosum TaxID=315347 RepID=A0AAF0PYR7_SOLVR|nr:hypothetical protein MTR67_005645 [Solanum verrucosum]
MKETNVTTSMNLDGALYSFPEQLDPGYPCLSSLCMTYREFLGQEDSSACDHVQLTVAYVPMLELKWNGGMKLDRGIDKNEWYFSALLEKPMS